MLEFTTRGTGLGSRAPGRWTQIFDYPDLIAAIQVSLELAAITSIAGLLLLVPTMVWVRLRLPKLQRVVEFLCLLP
jgi:putative spermidine/putrescine transport system permease protein